jgi:Sulfotransferase domain
MRHPLSEISEQGRRRALRARNRAYRTFRNTPAAERRTILVLGCQRSGTTLMLEVFDEDVRTLSFAEFSAISGVGDGGIRLRPLPEVKGLIERHRAPITVLKPLVESQHAPRLLDGLPNARAVWMFRGFESVAVSNVTYFGLGNPARDLRLLLTNDPPNWRGEFVPDDVRTALEERYAPDMSPYDAAALFWWARNRIFFDLGLNKRPDVFLCEYEALVVAPRQVIGSIYELCGVEPPARDTTRRIHSESRNRGDSSVIGPEVRTLCEELHERLLQCARARRPAVPRDASD